MGWRWLDPELFAMTFQADLEHAWKGVSHCHNFALLQSVADAILLANAAPQLSFIYFPPGKYRIAKSITVTKPILAGRQCSWQVLCNKVFGLVWVYLFTPVFQ